MLAWWWLLSLKRVLAHTSPRVKSAGVGWEIFIASLNTGRRWRMECLKCGKFEVLSSQRQSCLAPKRLSQQMHVLPTLLAHFVCSPKVGLQPMLPHCVRGFLPKLTSWNVFLAFILNCLLEMWSCSSDKVGYVKCVLGLQPKLPSWNVFLVSAKVTFLKCVLGLQTNLTMLNVFLAFSQGCLLEIC